MTTKTITSDEEAKQLKGSYLKPTEDFMLGNPNAQRIPLKKTFCSEMLKINLEDDFEQKVFLSAMRCA